MTLKEILKITHGKIISGEYKNLEVGKICIDSRIIEKNDIFIAVKGNKTDGNKFIDDIIDKASIIITKNKIKRKNKTPIIKVKNPLKTIKKIGIYNRKKYIDKPLIAITGSVGKTTTKDLLAHIFKTKYNILKTYENFNNEIGASLMLSRINEKHDIIILELGMNHLNEIEKMSKMCKPQTAIITNIGTSHIGYLKTQENILKAKMEITKGIKKGNLIVNGNDFFLSKIRKNRKYSLIKIKDNKIKNIIVNDKLHFTVNIKNKDYNIEFNIPNKYLIDNILLAISVAELYQIPVNNIVNAINTFKSPQKRLNVINLNNGIEIIDDTYNASLESIKSSLSMLENKSKTKLAIIGDVLELGKHTEEIHKKIESELNKQKNLNLITIGQHTKIIKKGIHFDTNEEAIKYLSKKKLSNTIILIKASHAMNFEEIKEAIINKYKIKANT